MNVEDVIIEDMEFILNGREKHILHKEMDLISIASEEDSIEVYNAKMIIGEDAIFVYGTIKFSNGEILSGGKIKCLVG